MIDRFYLSLCRLERYWLNRWRKVASIIAGAKYDAGDQIRQLRIQERTYCQEQYLFWLTKAAYYRQRKKRISMNERITTLIYLRQLGVLAFTRKNRIEIC